MNPQQAVAIAKDVLERLPQLHVRCGVYFQTDWFRYSRDSDLTLLDILEKINDECDVCALGACFLSYIHLGGLIKKEAVLMPFGQHNSSLYSGGYLIKKHLLDIFGEENLFCMEIAFEFTGVISCNHECIPPYINAAYKFGNKFQDNNDRLTAIMQNVIANNGNFRP